MPGDLVKKLITLMENKCCITVKLIEIETNKLINFLKKTQTFP